jgi:hypothetical protein
MKHITVGAPIRVQWEVEPGPGYFGWDIEVTAFLDAFESDPFILMQRVRLRDVHWSRQVRID